MKNKAITEKQVAEYLAIQKAIDKKSKRKATGRKKSKKINKTVKPKGESNPFGWVMLICLMLATAYFTTGCSYHPECDQTVNGRGNIPASCRGINHSGEK